MQRSIIKYLTLQEVVPFLQAPITGSIKDYPNGNKLNKKQKTEFDMEKVQRS